MRYLTEQEDNRLRSGLPIYHISDKYRYTCRGIFKTHRWENVDYTPKYAYDQCTKCGSRRIRTRATSGHSLVDIHWLRTGEWKKLERPPAPPPIPPLVREIKEGSIKRP